MKILTFITFIVVATALLLCPNADATKRAREPKPLDLKTPLDKILKSLVSLKDVNLLKLINVLAELFLNCLSSDDGAKTKGSLGFPVSDIPFTNEMKQLTLNSITPSIDEEDISKYCNGDGFKEIHNYMWVQTHEAEELLKFFHRFGYKDIYTSLSGWYDKYKCPEELKNTLPKEPTPSQTSSISVRSKSNLVHRKTSHIREEILRSVQNPVIQAECNIIEILTKFLETKVLNLLQFVQILISEFTTKPSLHFLLGKIQEPVKGEDFRGLRELEPFRLLMYKGHQAVLNNEGLRAVLELVKQFLGLDLIETNVLETILNVAELILWQNTVPVPPFEPPVTEPPTTEEETTPVDSTTPPAFRI